MIDVADFLSIIGKCDPTREFDCDDGTCIHISLKCDGEANCIYRYDEDKSDCEKGNNNIDGMKRESIIKFATFLPDSTTLTSFDSNHMIIILILFFCLVIGMCASIAVSCWGKIKDRRQRELEYKQNVQRSRDSSVEQGLNRALTMTHLNSSMECEYPATQMRASDGASIGRAFIKSSTNLVDPSSQEEEEEENGCYVPDASLGFYRKQPNGSLSMQDKYSPDTAHHHNFLIDHPLPSDDPYFHSHNLDNDRNSGGSESPIPPPPPPPALSHMRGRSARSVTLPLNLSSSKLNTDSPPLIDNHHHLHHPECAQHPHGNVHGSRAGDYRSASVGPPSFLPPHSTSHPYSHPASVAALEMDTEDELPDLRNDGDKVPSRHQRYRAEASIQVSSSTANRPRNFLETRSTPDVITVLR